MEHVRVISDVPLGVTVKGIQLAEGWRPPLIAPGETPILKINFRKLARIESSPKTIYPAPIDVIVIFVAGAADLIEVAKNKPAHAIGRFAGNNFREKIVLTVGGGGSIDVSDSEIALIFRVEQTDRGGKTKFSQNHIRDMNGRVIPKQQHTSSRPYRRPFCKAAQSVTTNVLGIGRRDRSEFGFLDTNNLARRGRNSRMNRVTAIPII
jgi:hypothetical protein